MKNIHINIYNEMFNAIEAMKEFIYCNLWAKQNKMGIFGNLVQC